VTDQPQIEFFAFKARKFCVWFEKTSQGGSYDPVQATHVVSGLIASAAKLTRTSLTSGPPALDAADIPEPPPLRPGDNFPVECREDWAQICSHRERTGGLPGCLSEVRRELQGGLQILGAGRPYDAASHWHLGYVHNWGELAICALMMLHSDLANTRSS
jgi:hypothetical protein